MNKPYHTMAFTIAVSYRRTPSCPQVLTSSRSRAPW